jgi:bacterioferritin
MKGDSNVIEALNKILSIELVSINQYFLHARMFRNWGLEELNEKAYKKSIKDMKQADDLIERILFLEGFPNLQHLGQLRIGEHSEEMLQCDMAFELEQVEALKQAITLCETKKDYISRELLESILEYEEDHIDWIETQQQLIVNIGSQNYLQSTMEG